MIRNNKAQSMITIMLLLMILGVVVTLIVSSTLTDTRKLLVQKSYERAYSLSEKYLTNIITGNVLGTSTNQLDGILNEPSGVCSIIPVTSITQFTSPVSLSCNGTGTDGGSIVNCNRTTTVNAKSLKIQSDEPVIIDYSKQTFTPLLMNTIHPKIHVKYKNAEAVQITYKYQEAIGAQALPPYVPKSVSFIVSNNTAYYFGAVPIPTVSGTGITTANYPVSLVDIVNKGGNNVITSVNTSKQEILDTLSSINGIGTNELTIDVEKLAINTQSTDTLLKRNTAQSVQIKFLNRTTSIVDFAIYHEGAFDLNGVQKELAYQFHKFKCDAFDSAYDSTIDGGGNIEGSTTTGFGSARLEAFVPINKALPDFFDYSLFVGGGVGGNSTTGYPVIINK